MVNYKSGDKYGSIMLTGKAFIKMYGGSTRRFVECICGCGSIFFTPMQNLKNSSVKSCGCKKIERLKKMNQTHGMSSSGAYNSVYATWEAMKSRCYNKKTVGFKNYGGRGIEVCERWRNSFENFYEDMGRKPHALSSIERVNVNGNYCKENCTWATRKVQSRNKRTNVFITAYGETKCFKDWRMDKRCKVSHGALFYRINKMKMEPEEAISTLPYKIN